MNRHEIFDKVKNHLLTQNLTCTNKGECRYRHDGMSRAVGAPIKSALSASGVEIDDYMVKMLTTLQMIHDDLEVDEWPEALENLENKLFGVRNE